MKRPSTLFLLFLSVSIASFHLLPAEQTNREFKERVREQRRIGETRLQDRQPRSVSTLKVLDFSADNDNEPDSNDKYTKATLETGPLPDSFTICSAFMVEAWTSESYSYYSKKNNAPRALVSEKNTAPRTKHRAWCPIKMKHRATYGHLARCLVRGAVFFSDTRARGAVMRG